tara:strand:- start:407 stop:997 length:591 start_codon:yes stop_codon:yes gene_type:complete
MSIKLNGATSGSVELDVPAAVTGGDVSLSLPGAGTVDRLERAGNILQVLQAVKTDTFSTASASSFVDITGLSVNITPSSASSKILILFSLPASADSGAAWYCNLVRDSTNIVVADAAGSRVRSTVGGYINPANQSPQFGYQFLDSPSTTSQVTYKLQLRAQTSTGFSAYINRTSTDTDNSNYSRSTSSITVMEVAA